MRYYARRHLLDTVGVMIAGAPGDVATNAETMLAGVRGGGKIPVPGRAKRHDLLDAAFLGGTAAHGIELDDGYRVGSAHCGCTVVPAALSVGYERGASGAQIIEAVVAGYEVAICLARACAPDLRQRGFHPTSAVGPLGTAVAVAKLRGLTPQQIADALGIAASASAGLFAFVNGGADIKRLHAGHASREGIQAALLAELGVQGPPNVVEARDGFMQAFAFGRSDKARPIALPPDAPFGITDCYIKPYACCRHIQPAVEALFGLMNDEKIDAKDISKVDVETYRIAAEHAHTGWDDYASAQLSFPYLMGLAARFRGIKVEHFNAQTRNDPAFGEFAEKLTVTAPPEIDGLYPKLRPARVTVTTARGNSCVRPTRRSARASCRSMTSGSRRSSSNWSSRCSAMRARERWCGSCGMSKRSATSGRWWTRRGCNNTPSCPALCRASTSCFNWINKVVDGRAKGRSRPSSTGYARP